MFCHLYISCNYSILPIKHKCLHISTLIFRSTLLISGSPTPRLWPIRNQAAQAVAWCMHAGNSTCQRQPVHTHGALLAQVAGWCTAAQLNLCERQPDVYLCSSTCTSSGLVPLSPLVGRQAVKVEDRCLIALYKYLIFVINHLGLQHVCLPNYWIYPWQQ